MKKVILTLIIFCAIFLTARAQLYFKNNYNQPVTVAIAFLSDTKDFKGWTSWGWITVEPNEKKEVLSGVPLNGYVYYYATSNIGEKFTGQHSFIIDPAKGFEIKNADMEYKLKDNGNYKYANFREVSMGLRTLGLKYTIEFNY